MMLDLQNMQVILLHYDVMYYSVYFIFNWLYLLIMEEPMKHIASVKLKYLQQFC